MDEASEILWAKLKEAAKAASTAPTLGRGGETVGRWYGFVRVNYS